MVRVRLGMVALKDGVVNYLFQAAPGGSSAPPLVLFGGTAQTIHSLVGHHAALSSEKGGRPLLQVSTSKVCTCAPASVQVSDTANTAQYANHISMICAARDARPACRCQTAASQHTWMISDVFLMPWASRMITQHKWICVALVSGGVLHWRSPPPCQSECAG